MRQIGWAVVLTVCVAGFVLLTFRVNAVKSEVRLAEREIIALEREKALLEIEFESRANQQQLADWNRLEFGYLAPQADQYLENERQLASLSVPRSIDAPDPIRVAHTAVESEDEGIIAMVSPLTGKPPEAASPDDGDRPHGKPLSAKRSLSDRLAIESPLKSPSAEVAQ
ncbi:hypothetical protein NSO95_13240 [Qipengyuania sp. RS5-5]|uniref:Cell division protein FtsL n=1 Tax=Parerythrobacter lacustris TaxID=2969984 RepID=A0ABT1XTD2_9SPHN|nr:hypothetical protein [Parerythrobacter lacustris]